MTDSLFWLSFADPRQPSGHQFLGVAIVRSCCPAHAPAEAHRLGCNPGGEVRFQEFTDEAAAFLDPALIGRLLTREEATFIDRMLGAAIRVGQGRA